MIGLYILLALSLILSVAFIALFVDYSMAKSRGIALFLLVMAAIWLIIALAINNRISNYRHLAEVGRSEQFIG